MIIQKSKQQNLFSQIIPETLKTLDPELAKIDELLDKDEILEMVEQAFLVKNKNAKNVGRKGYTLETRLRLLLAKHIYGWSYEVLLREVRGSITLREFTKIHLGEVPDKSRLIRWQQILSSEVIKNIHEEIVKIARKKRMIRGRKLRSDTTVVESNIHYPTDSNLLSDGIRKICRTIERLKESGVNVGKAGRNFMRSTKRRVLHIIKFMRGRKEETQEKGKKVYKELMNIGKEVLKNISKAKRAASMKLKKAGDVIQEIRIENLKEELDHWKKMLEQVLIQTQERILKGNKYFKEKIMSIFEPHTVGIKKGKAGKPIEFGRKVEITEVENKIISDYQVLEGHTDDTKNLPKIIDRHKKRFGKPPDNISYDRGGWTPKIEEVLTEKGVKRISIPAKGKRSKERKEIEKQRWFKNAQRFRAGSEGTISKLKRRHGLGRSLYKGEDGMEKWIGWGVISSNLLAIARQI